jgi:RHS repeat-associated protein
MKINRILCFFAFILSVCTASAQLSTLSLSAGQRHAMALRSDGSIWAWGTNQVGELGLGTNTLAMWPMQISSLSNVVWVSAGPLHTLAVQGNGTVWAWGTNNDGRLGTGTFTATSNPVPVISITNAVMVAAGANHSLAILANGKVMAWGANSGGQLGTGNTISSNQPVLAGSFTNAIAVAAGTNFSLALTADGSVWAWGTNNFGQLGIGNTTSQSMPVKITTISNIVQIAAGGAHCLALASNGVVYAWGANPQGQLGDGSTINKTTPESVPTFGATTNLGTVKWIASGYNSSAAVLTTGRLFYWGGYGNGTVYTNSAQATELCANSGFVFQNVVYGDGYLLANKLDGSTWAWGFNQYSQWGNGNIYATNDSWYYDQVNAEFSFSPSPYRQVMRFDSGDRWDVNPYAPYSYDLPYNTFVLPLDMEQGVRLANFGNNLYCYGANTPWFLRVQKTQRQHVWQLVGSTTNVTRFPVDNPMVAFGNDAGGSPLYTGQAYNFGVYAGAYDERTGQTNRFRILVYDRNVLASGATNVTPTNIITIALPMRSIASDSGAWASFVTNGNCVVIQTNGLTTVVKFHEGQNWYGNWGLGFIFETVSGVDMDGYEFTEVATTTNYCYVLEGLGSAEVGANVFTPMGVTNNNGWAYLPLYAMSFDAFPPLLSHFVNNPHFMGTPMPATYTGRSDLELSGLTAMVTNQIWLTNDPSFTNLDNSPELRRSPILDQFVSDMGNNPLALANYVINNIGLTDPMGNMESYNQVSDSIEVGGVNRSALGTYLEGQGSPTEQCALLVYLLRSAGYPAAYVWPTNSNLMLMDTTVSRLWQINVHGIIFNSGIPVETNSLITVDYPWVVANIGTNTVQIFPWIKNTSVVLGQDIYSYVPTNYPDAYSFIKAYALANPSLMALGTPNVSIIPVWQQWLTGILNSNQLQPNLSLNNFGAVTYNRPNTYTSWGQLPVPDFMTNQAQVAVVHTLSDSPVTYPFLTNMFDTIRIQVFDNTTNGTQIFDTGLWRACDFHNRKLLLYTNTASTVSLWLAAYRPGITTVSNFQNFSVGTNSLDIQIAQASISSAVSNFEVEITYTRRDSLLTSPANLWLPISEGIQPVYGSQFLTCSRSDMSAIIPGVARVTQPMLQVYAQDYWGLEQKRAANKNYIPAVTDEAGDAAMILASTFFEKMWSDDQFNQQIHEIRALTWYSLGAAALTPLSSGGMVVKLNMNWSADFLLGNGRVEQDAGDWGEGPLNNYVNMVQAEGSSSEHSVIASVWGDQSPVSAIRLLQIAAQNSISNGLAMPMELNIDNYQNLGNQSYTGYGGPLKSHIPTFWAAVTNVFISSWDSNFVRVLVTPGVVTNATGSYTGMSALIFGNTHTGDLMSQNATILHQGFDLISDWIGDYDPLQTYFLTYNLDYSPSAGYSFTYVSTTTPQPQYYFSPYTALTANLGGSGQSAQIAYTPQQSLQATLFSASMNSPFTSTPSAIQAEKNTGWFGNPSAGIKQNGTIAADPVQVVSGEFDSDAVDMTLAGPMPWQLRRVYWSQNVADGELGTGWKLSFMPRLVVTTNSANNPLIYAAETDGSVLAYRYQTNNLWTVLPADNPDLVNFTASGIGGEANLFNNTIQQNATNSGIYTLFGSDGSKRIYQVMTNFAVEVGTNQMNRVRPYLTLWQDPAGNYYQFTYGTNPTNNNYGQLYRVQGANGASLTFEYDFYGRIIQVISDDDRIANYQYDNYGDLVSVTLPDNTQWQYGYDHYTFTTNSQTYTDSDHLLITETKPNNRQLVNTYDSFRRVIMQQATVGPNRQLITNAWFVYNNNGTNATNSYVSGYTRVSDVFSNNYYYYYTNNLITQIQKPLGLTNAQSWFLTSQSNQTGYYQRSLQFVVDERGLTDSFLYDSNGNVTNQIASGDLTGNGVGGQTSTNTFTYTTHNCPATAIAPNGNQMTFLYNDPADAFHLTDLQFSSSGVGIATNHWFYTNVTTIVNMGGWFETNSAYGLCWQQVLADSATNTWSYNGRGFPVQLSRYAVTANLPNDSDPPVVVNSTFTPRGDLGTVTDAIGRQVNMNYDEMGRMQWRDVFDENGNVVSHETFYYNQNGDLEWYDGPRSNPDDYVWFSYDGAGRKVQEIHWLIQANPNGTGIQPVPGNNLYATTFYTYDYFGNLTSVTDQRGATRTNLWDALGRLTQRTSFDVGGVTPLSTEGFGYEPGGMVQFYTNALGGVTETLYNSAGQPRFRQNTDGSTNGWTYYLDGRPCTEIQNNGAYWQTTYNDAALTATRIFYSPTGSPLATNSIVFDRRGNASLWTDAGGNTFTNYFDGLGRLKAAFGPQIISVNGSTNVPGGMGGGYTTNVVQQVITYLYDSCGKTLTVSNALGETTTTTFDAIGRTVGQQIYPAGGGSPIRTSTIAYSSDNNSFTATLGSGAGAITTTTYLDTYNRPLLSIGSPAPNVSNLILRNYDSVGNLASESQASMINNAITTWQTTSLTYDGLNRVKTLTQRDNALTSFSYDSAGDLTNRIMPGATLTWSATYNNAGQILTEQDSSGGAVTRGTAYTYYPVGSPFAGLPNTVTDGDGVTRIGTYDNWLRVTNVTSSGLLPAQQMTVGWTYEPRGYVTDLTQSFANGSTGASTEVQRSFDPYGQLATETVNLGGSSLSSFGQTWDNAGRRTQLAGNLWSGSFAYQADGLMTAGGGATFGYGNNGLLTGRTNSFRSYTINQRDGLGEPLAATTRVGFSTALAESWNWLGDGSPAVYIAQRSDYTDTRNFAYGPLNRRLIQESFNVASSQLVTNNYTFDNGASGGMGVLTTATESSITTNSWGGGLDAFSRTINGTDTVAERTAYGNLSGPANVTAALDGVPVAVSLTANNGGQWYSILDLTPGTHQLTAWANPPGSLFVTNVTSIFTNDAADTSSNTFDANGQITQRVWLSANGQTNRIQTLTWDAFNRLTQVSERDSFNNGYNWQADFDPLGRRIRTTTVNVSNNIVMSSQPTTIVHYYDPQVEFLEIGVTMNGGLTTWKNYGPDLNGVYGSEQGLGGLESLTTGYTTVGLIQDGFGNVMGSVTNLSVAWNAARVDNYGAVDGYPALSFETAPLTPEHLAWRGKWRDMTGLYYWGARPYDSERRAFLSTDPYGHDADDSLYSAFNGSPTAFWDADGRDFIQAFLPATAAAMGAKPFSGSTAGDVAWVHGVVYPTMQLPFAPVMEPHVQGGLKVVGGVTETTVGGLGVATTSETGVGAVVSTLALGHGLDTVQSGWRQMMSGQQTPSFTQIGITRLTGSPAIGSFSDATIGTVLTFGAGATIDTTRLGVSSVTVNQVGNYWIKQVNPNASGLAQWWGQMNLDAQAASLKRLGNQAVPFTYENGVMITQDAGVWSQGYSGNFWKIWWNGSKTLGTPFNDIRPNNIGANGLIFDPAKNWIQQSAEASMFGLAITYGAVQIYNHTEQSSTILSKH